MNHYEIKKYLKKFPDKQDTIQKIVALIELGYLDEFELNLLTYCFEFARAKSDYVAPVVTVKKPYVVAQSEKLKKLYKILSENEKVSGEEISIFIEIKPKSVRNMVHKLKVSGLMKPNEVVQFHTHSNSSEIEFYKLVTKE